MSQKDGPPRVQGTPGSQSSVWHSHIQVVAEPVQGLGGKGIGRAIPALGRCWGGCCIGAGGLVHF